MFLLIILFLKFEGVIYTNAMNIIKEQDKSLLRISVCYSSEVMMIGPIKRMIQGNIIEPTPIIIGIRRNMISRIV